MSSKHPNSGLKVLSVATCDEEGAEETFQVSEAVRIRAIPLVNWFNRCKSHRDLQLFTPGIYNSINSSKQSSYSVFVRGC